MTWRTSLPALLTLVWLGHANAAEVIELTSAYPRLIMIQGELQLGDEDKFIQVALPVDHAIVLFNSEGGNLHAGIEIGKAIKLKQFHTLVAKDTYCASACALAWLAGVKRFMEPGSRIGFHSAYEIEAGKPKTSGPANARVGAYLNQLGLSVDAIVFISTAPPESMQWLTATDANQYGIAVDLLHRTVLVAQPDQSTNGERWLLKDGIDLFGFDLQSVPINTASASECETKCQKEAGCRAFTFNTRNSVCFMKSSAEIAYRNDRAISGYQAALEQGLKQSPFTIEEGTDYAGSDFQELTHTSFGDCLQACEAHPGCMAFSYIGRRKQCWLKSAAGAQSKRKGVTSGVKEPAE